MDNIYYGRTELGVGQHETIRKRLEAERHREYQEHMARKNGDQILANELPKKAEIEVQPAPEPQPIIERTSSVADIGYESSTKIAEQKRQLNEARKAEYEAILAAKTANSNRNDGNNGTENSNDRRHHAGENADASWWPESAARRRQNQQNYADALREQIANQQEFKKASKIKEQEDDRKRDLDQARMGKNGTSFI
ncbi:Hypothetical protein NTJ_16057 [Nesidiocoris tenuis]|uniref:CBF1-interacting co-repressor CIR N-terminal domain-containing protein n=1 Tax=Nesidiocoris tenuis TaxID=355587 RepID=A0ABN7BG23_9HEMI|nr:Hypothetical protein NTJ_16057 [Nesidiocoris tenuis]